MARAPLVFVVLGLLGILCGPAQAAQTASSTAPAQPSPDSPPDNQLFFRSTNVFRYNPLGLITDNQLSFRHLLYRRDDNALMRNNFVGAGFTPQISAAFARVGALVEVQPLSVLRLWANFDVVGYFGTFGLLQSFDSPNADFSDTVISARGALPDGDPQKNFSTWGSQLTLGVDLQMKVGPIAARNLFRLVRGSYQIRDGDTVYYDQFYDLLAPNNGVYVNNDTDLLYVSDFGLVAGVRMNVTQPFYGPEHFGAADRAGGLDHQNGPTFRAGPLATYTFFDDPTALFNKPTIIVVANWWGAHRYRTGADVNQAIPYFVVGFQVTSDLLPHLLNKKETSSAPLEPESEPEPTPSPAVEPAPAPSAAPSPTPNPSTTDDGPTAEVDASEEGPEASGADDATPEPEAPPPAP